MMHIGRIWQSVCLVTLCSALLAQPAGAMEEPPIKIGVIAPLTGPASSWGLAMSAGAQIAVDEANAGDGFVVDGKRYRVQIIPYDDQYKATEAVSAYNRLTRQDGAKYLMIMASGGSVALKKNFESDKVVGFSAAYSSKLIDSSNRFLYRIYSTPNDFGGAMIDWLRAQFAKDGAPKVAILNPNDESGWDLGEFEKKEFHTRSFEVVASEAYERGLKDFQPLLTRILALGPALIDLGISSPATAGLIVRQARELGYEGKFSKLGGSGLKDIADIAGPKAADGLVGVMQWDDRKADVQALAEAYRKRMGHNPTDSLGSYYNAAKILLAGIRASGAPNDTEKFVEKLPSLFPVVALQGDPIRLTGLSAYGADKQLKTVLILGKVTNGVPVVLERLEAR